MNVRGAVKQGSGWAVLGIAIVIAAGGCAHSEDQPERPVVMLITGSMIVDDFFDVMAERLEGSGFRPIVFQPPDLFTQTLKIGAQRIGDTVDSILAEQGVDRIHVIAECNGGVAGRYYLEQLDGHPSVDRFISFVSAHHGTEWADPPLYPALADIAPGSEYLRIMDESRLPEGSSTTMISIYICGDEIMEPYTTSRIEGALNIEVCDEELARRAKARAPYDVHNLIGQIMIPMFPLHFAGFWDEDFFYLLLSCLKDDPDTIRDFDLLDVRFD